MDDMTATPSVQEATQTVPMTKPQTQTGPMGVNVPAAKVVGKTSKPVVKSAKEKAKAKQALTTMRRKLNALRHDAKDLDFGKRFNQQFWRSIANFKTDAQRTSFLTKQIQLVLDQHNAVTKKVHNTVIDAGIRDLEMHKRAILGVYQLLG